MLLILLAPQMVLGSVWISEIHYNPEGSDADSEWIEVHNTSERDVTLAEYSFREQGTNHRIEATESTSAELPSGAYAVIADKPSAFLDNFPNYTGALFDSAFSLRNTGEQLEILNPDKQVVFEVSYDSATGGDGNGYSIGLIDDVWYEVVASPGEANNQAPTNTHNEDESEDDDETSSQEEANTQDNAHTDDDTPPTPATYLELDTDYEHEQIKVDAGGDRTVMAGASYRFTGTVYGLEGGIISEPQARWNWGDGTSDVGAAAIHRYRYPGEYTLTFAATVLEHSDYDRASITVIPPALELVMHPDDTHRIGIENTSDYHLELSRYELFVPEQEEHYTFPPHSFINAGNTMWLDSEILGFDLSLSDRVQLRDGEGSEIDTINLAQTRLAEQIETKQASSAADSQVATSSRETSTSAPVQAVSHTYPDQSSARNTHSVSYLAPVPRQDSTSLHNTQDAATQVALPQQPTGQQASVYQAGASTSASWYIYGMAVIAIALVCAYTYYRKHYGVVPDNHVDYPVREYHLTDRTK